jgi:pimeloyl-ACP methyl ester carboxylesterase
MRCGSIFHEMPDGVKIHILRQLGTPLNCILLHGFGEGSFVWNSLRSTMTPICNMFMVDLRGHGQSDWDAANTYDTPRYSRDISNILDRQKLTNLILIGHSLGAEICIDVAKKMGRSVKALVLVDCSPEADPEAVAHMIANFRSEHRAYTSAEEYAEVLQSKRPILKESMCQFIAKSALREAEDGYHYLKCDPDLASSRNWEAPRAWSIWDDLGRISCPVLLVRGGGSAIVSKSAGQNLANRFKNCSYKTVSMAGHSVMLDNPSEFDAMVKDFLLSIS